MSTQLKATLKEIVFNKGECRELKTRGISRKTCEFFNYQVGLKEWSDVKEYIHIANWLNHKGEVVGQKMRDQEKDFWVKGKLNEFYGQWLWKTGKFLVITEGELDALSYAEVTERKYPVVSIPHGSGGAKDVIKKHLKWLEENFEKIVLAFDQDDAGKLAVEECAPLFSFGKCLVAQLTEKDINDLLLKGKRDEIVGIPFRAKEYRPSQILVGEALLEEALKPVEYGISLPWDALTKATYGWRLHEIWSLGTGTGMGKTEFLKELAYHLCYVEKKKVGVLFLEEPPSLTTIQMVGKHLGKRLHKPDTPRDESEIRKAFNDVFGENLVIFDHKGDSEFEVVKDTIHYMVRGLECQYILLDHITALAEGKGEQNINGYIHEIVTTLDKMTEAMPFSIAAVSHIRKSQGVPAEEGGRVRMDDFYGSGAIKQRSNFVFALEGNQQSEVEEERHIRQLRILKDRFTGESAGTIIPLRYDQLTGRFLEDSPGVAMPVAAYGF